MQADEAVAMARALAHPYGLAEALHQRADLLVLLRDAERALADTDDVLGLAQDIPRLTALTMFTRGAALTSLGETAEGIAAMQAGLEGLRSTGTVLGVARMVAEITTHSSSAGSSRHRPRGPIAR